MSFKFREHMMAQAALPNPTKEFAVYDGLKLQVRDPANWGESFRNLVNPTLIFIVDGQDLNEVFASLSKEGGVLRYGKKLWRVKSICNVDIKLSGKIAAAEWGFWARELDEMEVLREQFREWETA